MERSGSAFGLRRDCESGLGLAGLYANPFRSGGLRKGGSAVLVVAIAVVVVGVVKI